MPTTHRFTTLDGMRGVAAISVMLYHLTQNTKGGGIMRGGYVAVDLFFCLSGFVVAYAYMDRLQGSMSFREFMIRRVIRLYPMFFIGLCLGALALIVKYALGQTSLNVRNLLEAISLNALYLPYLHTFYVQYGNSHTPSALFPVDDPAWSLFFEFLVNIAFGLIAVRIRRFPAITLTALGAIGLLIDYKITHLAGPGWGATNIMGGFPRTMFGFFSGVFLISFFNKYRSYIKNIPPVVIGAALVTIMIYVATAKEWLLVTLILVPILVLFGSVSVVRSERDRRVFEYLGWISYPLYCIHYPIYSLSTSIAGSNLAASAAAVVVSLSLAHFLAKVIEEPVRERLTQRFLQRRAVVSGVSTH